MQLLCHQSCVQYHVCIIKLFHLNSNIFHYFHDCSGPIIKIENCKHFASTQKRKPHFIRLPKHFQLFPLAPENCNLNNFVWVFLHTLSGVFRLSAKYGLSRFLLSSCCHANNDIIHANCRFFNRFCKRNNLHIIK